MLQIENASIAYGNDILFSGFNLQLARGEIDTGYLSPFQLQGETREKYIVAVGVTGIFYLQHGVPLIFLYRKDIAKEYLCYL